MAVALLPNPSFGNRHPLSFKRREQAIWIRPAHSIQVRASSAPTSTTGEYKNANDVKTALYQALEGVDRGIFGVTSAKKSEIEGLVEILESQNPTPEPTTQLQEKVDGYWKLVYSTITILGSKRTKLGLRGFITLGDFFQIINVPERVDITLESSSITPDQLMGLFEKNYDLLLNVFNPEGWLEITYVDESLRIGRDDKGNIFVLERSDQTEF
ncbi:hypothetical protein LUZ63_004801 [Rhynchospora breviuscula]|uniref:Plastid lipid-associated protein/fibrillin conserved domain-containing protein n=1 Tax=Rhynchospora breviuscula TaxID=2022672 RepID=A0A9Q0CMU1_9POAL|nr:hypothetical protein LUZ63_004801 [Rhynchospora breviuscula]